MRRFSFAVILVLALAPGNAGAVSFSEEHTKELRTFILSLINESRVAEDLAPLTLHDGIQRVAELHADDTVLHFNPSSAESREQSYLAHTSSDGRSLAARFRDAKVEAGWEIAENAGYWTRSPYGNPLEASKFGLRMIHAGMMAEVPPNDGHRKTVLGNFTHIGIGLALFAPEDAETNAVFVVTNFSRYGSQPTSPRSFLRAEIPVHGGPFLDISPEHEYALAITSLKEKKILEGYSDGNFEPEKAVNRAEFLKMLLDVKEFSPIGREFTQCFIDVPSYQWFAPYVCVAEREGWVKGYADKTFRPETSITRAEAVTLTARIFAIASETFTLPFNDVPRDAWFSAPLQSIASRNLLPFTSGIFSPHTAMKRGEVAEMLYRTTKK